MDFTTVLAAIGGVLTVVELAERGYQIVNVAKSSIGLLTYKPEIPIAVGLSLAADEQIDMSINEREVAVLVQISQPVITSVRQYMDEAGIDANLFVISHDSGTFSGSELSNEDPAAWEHFVDSFYEYMQAFKQEYSPHVHLFFAGPATLAFAMGTKIGKWYNVSVYNYDPRVGTYYHVINTPVGNA